MGRYRRCDDRGAEIIDPVPMAPPVGYRKPAGILDNIRNIVRSEMLREEVARMGKESFEEADDFDVPDEIDDPRTPYEEVFDPPPRPPVHAKPSARPRPSDVVPSAGGERDADTGGKNGSEPGTAA